MNMIDYVNEDYTIIVNDELTRREIMKRHPLAKVMLSTDDAIGGKGLLIDSYAQDGLGVKAAKYKFSERNIVIRRFTKEFVEGNNDKSEDTLELETDKAKELQKYSEQIAKKKEELSNEHTQDNHKLFNEIITDLEQTYIAKNKDYGNSFEESLNEFGEIAGLVRIGDKFNRAKNLSENKANVIDESKIDTYLDMANYCIMQAMWLMKSKL